MACKSSDVARRPTDPVCSRQNDKKKQCILCGKATDRYMTRYSSWGESEKKFIIKHLNRIPTSDSYICKKHLIEAKRYHGKNTQALNQRTNAYTPSVQVQTTKS